MGANVTRNRLVTVGLVAAALLAVPFIHARASTPPIIFEPAPTNVIERVYVNGEPVAVITDPTFPAIVHIGVERLDSRYFLKVWLYLLNRSSDTWELVPQKQVSLQVLDDAGLSTKSILPRTPSSVLESIESEKSKSKALAFFSGVLGALAVSLSPPGATEIRTQSSTQGRMGSLEGSTSWSAESQQRTILRDQKQNEADALERVRHRTSQSIDVIEALYDNMKQSVSSQLLRRNTLRPGVSANGNVWFEFGRKPSPNRSITTPAIEKVRESSGVLKLWKPELWRFRVDIELPDRRKVTAEFSPVEGE